jgi:AcrR family transcriptional regulator
LHPGANFAILDRMASPGLRERKKVATKEALSQAALDLTIERGLDAATADAIAERADVSPRTFHNYFSSKEDAVLFALEKMASGFVEAFAARDPDESVLESLEAVVVGFVESDDAFDRMVAVTRLMAEHPALIARHVATLDTTSDPMLAEIGRRTGTDPAVDLYPRIVFHAANAVGRAVVELHITNESDAAPSRQALVAAVHEGFAQLRRGLPEPTGSD